MKKLLLIILITANIIANAQQGFRIREKATETNLSASNYILLDRADYTANKKTTPAALKNYVLDGFVLSNFAYQQALEDTAAAIRDDCLQDLQSVFDKSGDYFYMLKNGFELKNDGDELKLYTDGNLKFNIQADNYLKLKSGTDIDIYHELPYYTSANADSSAGNNYFSSFKKIDPFRYEFYVRGADQGEGIYLRRYAEPGEQSTEVRLTTFDWGDYFANEIFVSSEEGVHLSGSYVNLDVRAKLGVTANDFSWDDYSDSKINNAGNASLLTKGYGDSHYGGDSAIIIKRGDGYVIRDRNEDNYGEAGSHSFDVSNSTSSSATRGVTGYGSAGFGEDVTITGPTSLGVGAYGVHELIMTGSCQFAVGGSSVLTGKYAAMLGYYNTVSGKHAMARGMGLTASGDYSYNSGGGMGNVYRINTSGFCSFSHQKRSLVTSDADIMVAGDFSSVLGGENNSILSSATGAVVLGGNGRTATQPWTTYAEALMLFPQASPPPNPEEGTIYMDETSHKLRCWDGSVWNDLW